MISRNNSDNKIIIWPIYYKPDKIVSSEYFSD